MQYVSLLRSIQAINKYPLCSKMLTSKYRAPTLEIKTGHCQQTLTWQTMSLLEKRTIIRYLGVLYLFLSCTTKRLRAKKSVFPSGRKNTLQSLEKILKNNFKHEEEDRTGSLTSPPPEFDLVPLEVGLVFHHFNKTLQERRKSVRTRDVTKGNYT